MGMEATSDSHLVARFVHERSEEAFRTLVERYGTMVYALCLRRLNQDRFSAEDACQAVFLALARKAPQLHAGTRELGPWLHRAAFYVTTGWKRREARRSRLELEAGRRKEEARLSGHLGGLSGENIMGLETAEKDLAPLLDAAIDALPEAQRRAVVLHFFQGMTCRQAGEVLGASEDAVRMRVNAAVERLRRWFARQGVCASPALLGASLENMSFPSCPSSLVQMLMRTAMGTGTPGASAAAAVSSSTIQLAQEALHMLLIVKLKGLAAACVAVAVLLCATGAVVYRVRAGEPPPAPRVEAAPKDPTAPVVRPGQVAVTEPNKEGLVIKLRPLLSQACLEDGVTLALHFEAKDGMDLYGTKEGRFAYGHSRCLGSFEFEIRDSVNSTWKLKLITPKIEESESMLGTNPTYLLKCNASGCAQAHTTAAWGDVMPWLDLKAPAPLSKPGIYMVAIRGKLGSNGSKAEIAFESGQVKVELLPSSNEWKPVREIESAAKEAMIAHLNKNGKEAQAKLADKPCFITIEDPDGRRLVRFNFPREREPTDPPGVSADRYEVAMTPAGQAAAVAHEKLSSCVAHGTLVETEHGPKSIDKIQTGERLWGYEVERHRRVLTTVESVVRLAARESWIFAGTLRVTAQHPVLANGQWTPAAQIGPGDFLRMADGTERLCGPVKRITEAVEVFDLSVSPPHNFFAGGFLVHNKSMPWSPKSGDPWHYLWERVKTK